MRSSLQIRLVMAAVGLFWLASGHSLAHAQEPPTSPPSAAAAVGTVSESKQSAELVIQSVHNRKQDLEFQLAPEGVGSGGIWVITKSKRLSALLMQDLAARGYPLAESFESATTRFSLDPAMTLEKKGRQVNLNIAALVEKHAAANNEDLASGTFKSGIKAGVASNTAGFAGGSALKAGGAFFLLDNVLDATGVSAKVNELTTGDARGYCIAKIWGGCKEWDLVTHYTRLVVAVRLPSGEVKKGLLQADSLIDGVDPGMAFRMAWSDLNKAMVRQKIGKCFENNHEDCIPQ